MAKLGIVKEFVASHGRKKIHQHNFKIEISFVGDLQNEMVSGIDFHEIIPFVDNIIKNLRGKYLNDIEEFGRATVENIAIYFLKVLKDKFPVYYVKVWEDVDRYACIYIDDLN